MIEDASNVQASEKTWEETIEHDHHAIKEILARLEATMDPHLLLPILEELRLSLVEHFAREEAPEGLHELIADMSPNTVASLQNILGEHEQFLVRLDSLIERARTVVRGPLAEILLEAELEDDMSAAHYRGAKVGGGRVSGAKVSGAKVGGGRVGGGRVGGGRVGGRED